MAITLEKLSQAMKTCRREKGGYMALRDLLIESLAPVEQRVLLYVGHSHVNKTSGDVQAEFEISAQNASTVLKHLVDLGLLRRQVITDEHGKHWSYYL